MSFRSLTALGLLIFAVAMERCGYYAVRSFLMIDLTRSAGMPVTQASTLYSALTLVAYVGTFAGGGLAFAFGPRVTAIVGAAVATVGAFALAAGAPVAATAFIVALGSAIFKPCPYAAAAAILADEDGSAAQGFQPSARRFAAFATFCVLTYAAINAGSMIAPLVAGLFRDTRSAGSAYGFAGAVDLLAAVLAAITLALGTRAARNLAQQAHAPYRAPQADAAPLAPEPFPSDDAVWTPLSLLGVSFICVHLAMDFGTPDPRDLGLPNVAWFFSISPVVVILVTVPSAALYLVLAIQRSSMPLSKPLGIGLLVFAGGGILATFALTSHASIGFWSLTSGITALGEAIIFPLGLVYASLAVRGRAATMVVAGWLALTGLPTLMLGALRMTDRYPFVAAGITGTSAIVIAVAGVFVLRNADRLQRLLGSHSNATS